MVPQIRKINNLTGCKTTGGWGVIVISWRVYVPSKAQLPPSLVIFAMWEYEPKATRSVFLRKVLKYKI
jgi:hypothetical protein